jgi:hypothetical protein
MAQTGLDEFKELLSDFRSLSGLAIKGTVVLPLFNLWIKLGPPPSVAISTLTSVTMFLAVLWVFHFLHDEARDRLGIKMKVSIVVAFLAALGSFILLEQFTVSWKKGADAVVAGFQVRPNVAPLLNTNYTDRQALADAQYQPELIWSQWSITVVHVAMVLCWLLAFLSVARFVAMFILLQKRSLAPTPEVTSLNQ